MLEMTPEQLLAWTDLAYLTDMVSPAEALESAVRRPIDELAARTNCSPRLSGLQHVGRLAGLRPR